MILGASLVLMENGEWRRLDSLQPGERVATVDERRAIVSTGVTAKALVSEAGHCRLRTHQRRHLQCDLDQVFVAVDGPAALRALSVGDWILAKFDDGRVGWDAIEAIEPAPVGLLFSLGVACHGNVIAEGLLVHV
ncbi:MAG: hypothetical protein ABFE07_28690 [Armatimonadia bacterium]